MCLRLMLILENVFGAGMGVTGVYFKKQYHYVNLKKGLCILAPTLHNRKIC